MRRPDSFDRRVFSDWRKFRWGDARLMYADLRSRMRCECCDQQPLTRADAERLSDALAEELAAIRKAVATINRKVTHVATQADVDAVAAALHQEDSDLNSAVSAIQAKLADLEQQVANGQPVDLSGLQAEVANLGSAVSSAAALVPAPAPAPGDGGTPPADGGSGDVPPTDGGAPADGSGDAPSA